MVDSSPEIQSLLEFILKEKFFEDQAYYYNEINNYLIKQFSTPPIQVYSIHSKEGHSTFKRKVWSHDNNFSHFSELDENLMLRNYPNWYVVGEMLDWEAPTGGFLLQGCFSTAYQVANTIKGKNKC